MSAPSRSILSISLASLLLLSGWAVALGLGWRLREYTRHPEAVTNEHHPVPGKSPIERAFQAFTEQPEAKGAAVGFCVLDENGATLFASPLAEVALCPASSLKTVTTGAALSILGPEFQFETVLATNTPLGKNGTLDGDLVLVGSGDPTLAEEDLDELAAAAVAAGLKAVHGGIQVDTSVFPENPVSDHWVWGDLGNAYGVGAFGLNLNHNSLELTFQPGAQPGDPAPLLKYSRVPRDTRWINSVTTGPIGSGDEVTAYSAPYGRDITLRGTVPAGEKTFTISGALPDPPALAVELLRARLEAAGVKFTERAASTSNAPATTGRTILARHSSEPLPEIIDHLHRVSDNLEAQCLFLTLGHKLQDDPSTAIRAFWERAGVTFAGLRLIDGSGLARANMIRPLDLARVNYAARHSAVGPRFYDSLSAYLDGNVRAKIGGMSGVKTQVGFLRTAKGREYTFAIMGNGLASGRGFWRELEKLLEAIRVAE